eukprot:TRINITY_DN2533_c0_g1_i1.p1 TRINITY_DN2533_c0_g1~~TRINITY_DN2533_c0_g1_i1.p1  ORF type:complete len:343 (+),score=104.13 TRINITY_DN2533_c0_g1_i1:33-1061(+)
MAKPFSIIESGTFQLSNYLLEQPGLNIQRPEKLIVKICIPDNITDLELQDGLDVEEKKVIFAVEDKIDLQIPLKYHINEDLSEANYTKSQRVLELVLPLVNPQPGDDKLIEKFEQLQKKKEKDAPLQQYDPIVDKKVMFDNLYEKNRKEEEEERLRQERIAKYRMKRLAKEKQQREEKKRQEEEILEIPTESPNLNNIFADLTNQAHESKLIIPDFIFNASGVIICCSLPRFNIPSLQINVRNTIEGSFFSMAAFTSDDVLYGVEFLLPQNPKSYRHHIVDDNDNSIVKVSLMYENKINMDDWKNFGYSIPEVKIADILFGLLSLQNDPNSIFNRKELFALN